MLQFFDLNKVSGRANILLKSKILLTSKNFTTFFHFGKCEILLKSKILLKLHLLKSKNYCNQSPAPSSHSSIHSLNNSLRQISPQMDAQVTGSFDEFLSQNPIFFKNLTKLLNIHTQLTLSIGLQETAYKKRQCNFKKKQDSKESSPRSLDKMLLKLEVNSQNVHNYVVLFITLNCLNSSNSLNPLNSLNS